MMTYATPPESRGSSYQLSHHVQDRWMLRAPEAWLDRPIHEFLDEAVIVRRTNDGHTRYHYAHGFCVLTVDDVAVTCYPLHPDVATAWYRDLVRHGTPVAPLVSSPPLRPKVYRARTAGA